MTSNEFELSHEDVHISMLFPQKYIKGDDFNEKEKRKESIVNLQ